VGQGIKISVAGARPAQNLFTLDGTAYNDALNNTPASANGVMTGVETIQEFRVVTNTMSAEYGRAGGGVFNVVTKSGLECGHMWTSIRSPTGRGSSTRMAGPPVSRSTRAS
jgi:outer membrane receptor for ferrienterochelin and colicin